MRILVSSGGREQVPAKAVFLEADLRNADAVERALAAFRPEVVDHHAAQIDIRRSVAAPAYDAMVNIVGTLHLLDAARRYGVRRVIFASTSGDIYGEPANLPATEETQPEPLSPYGAAKLAAERPSSCATATSMALARTPTAKRGSSRSSRAWPCGGNLCASTATENRHATTSMSVTSCRPIFWR